MFVLCSSADSQYLSDDLVGMSDSFSPRTVKQALKNMRHTHTGDLSIYVKREQKEREKKK